MKSKGALVAVTVVGTLLGVALVAAIVYFVMTFLGGRSAGLTVEPTLYYDLRGTVPAAVTVEDEVEATPEAVNEAPLEEPALTLDVAGSWMVIFERVYFMGENADRQEIGNEVGTLVMEVPAGEVASVTLMPEEISISGEPAPIDLALQPRVFPAEMVGNTLRVHLDVDDFYFQEGFPVFDTTDPEYLEFMLAPADGVLSGEYQRTWVIDMEGTPVESWMRFQIYKES